MADEKYTFIEQLNTLPMLPEFKGEESIQEWSRTMECVAIAMENARDKQGLLIFVDTKLMLLDFWQQCQTIRRCMNNKDGAMLIKVPHSTDNDFDDEE